MPSKAEVLADAKRRGVLPPRVYHKAKPSVHRTVLAETRVALGLAQCDVYKALGIHAVTMSRMELGAEVSLTNARAVADFFGKTVDELWPRQTEERDA